MHIFLVSGGWIAEKISAFDVVAAVFITWLPRHSSWAVLKSSHEGF